MDSLNQLSTINRSGNLTVAGNTLGRVTNVTVNTLAALLYEDATFARTNMSLSDGNNTFTAIAKDSFGRTATNASTTYLPATLTCVYDLNGNLRTNGNRVLDYDDENQLIAVTVSNAWRSEFVYDGEMRRRIRTEYTWQSSAWVKTNEVRYVYDGNLVIQERNTNNVVAVTYTRGKDLSGSMEGAGGIGGLLARSANIRLLFPETPTYTHAYYHSDGNGNVTCLINTNEIIVAKYVYDPFGNTLSASGPLADANLYRFSSKELHQNSGLVYYLYRHYAANLQRWLNRDPIEEDGGINQYGFVLNNPIIWIDSDGRVVFVIPAIGAGLRLCLASPPCAAALARAIAATAAAIGGAICKPKEPDCTLKSSTPTGYANSQSHCVYDCGGVLFQITVFGECSETGVKESDPGMDRY